MCDSFVLDHQCEINGCKKNLVLDGNFDNNRECCMAKDSGFIQYDSLPGQIRSGCIMTPKLGSRFCEKHMVDHKELDKEKMADLSEAISDLGETLGPVLRSSHKKSDYPKWGQVVKILQMRTLRNKKFFKVLTLYHLNFTLG